ncbi:NAD-binding protein [Pigmentiphaga sp.]|uniref:NAD-binding protein n=1 Tax=Pigmentiphaga sp. TaxID=1977564 RepID=UPI00128B816B|nr:NAD-binding protein [Pigmentiphaga sp.]MPS54860.1 hypothetical protein [Alcaligenaceae bacterium SAGV3]MPT60074.1 hypothetical protein [Alcaligenaceae bacterium]
MKEATGTGRADRAAGPIGFVGLGAMGAPMARWLVSRGHDVIVSDLNHGAVADLVGRGARTASTLKGLASEASTVFTCLPSLRALREVALGAEGLQHGTRISTLVDFSTTGPAFALELGAALAARKIDFLDAPITGNVVTAGNGTLGIMCSGPSAAFERARPVMADLASIALLHLGERNGRAQTLKLLNNLLSATGMAVACEAMILGTKAGLDPAAMLEAINASDASSSATRNKFARSVLTRSFDFGARMAITAKDTSLAAGVVEELGVPAWIARRVQQLWGFAASQGGAERDGTSLITYLEPWAGVEVGGGRVAEAGAATGQAQWMDRLVGAVSATLLAAACEAFVAGAKAGLDPITMTRILGIETGRNFASSRVLPEQVATRTFAYGKSLGAALNDLDFVADEARRLGVTTWVLDGTRSLYRLAAGLGGGGEDMSRLATYYEAWAGAEVRIPAPGDQKQGK